MVQIAAGQQSNQDLGDERSACDNQNTNHVFFSAKYSACLSAGLSGSRA